MCVVRKLVGLGPVSSFFFPLQGLPELTQALLDKGASLTAADKEGRTPLLHAILQHNTPLALQLADLKGADFNAADTEERTPVMHALLCGNPGLALKLLERGAEIDLKDKDDKTALLYATEKLNEEVCAEPQIYPPLPFRTLPVEGVKPWVLTLLLGASRRRGGLFPPAQLFISYLFQAIRIHVGAV